MCGLLNAVGFVVVQVVGDWKKVTGLFFFAKGKVFSFSFFSLSLKDVYLLKQIGTNDQFMIRKFYT